ncbi:hypothetical protein CBP12_11800 [Oceanisphaera avium]|uniref:Uncharacterized protein n=1 Tax=Oceanisphaera avium TaxID=1903694 RepID=A0A1Y0CZJ5_9GAMM|nr:hypothetical protein CBP12_11800 [Oceanisphaera avium]
MNSPRRLFKRRAELLLYLSGNALKGLASLKLSRAGVIKTDNERKLPFCVGVSGYAQTQM